MKRDQLKDLQLTDKQIEQIMKLNGHLVKKVERGSIRLGWIYDKIEYLKANKSL